MKRKGKRELKYRKEIPVSDATEEELLRWHMENLTKESYDCSPGERASGMVELYRSFQNAHSIRLLVFAIFL